jgi:hypothetical protein
MHHHFGTKMPLGWRASIPLLTNATSITPVAPALRRAGECVYVGQISMQISAPIGSIFSANQHIYIINAVDEVTQMQCIVAVERISEMFLVPALNQMMESFPFVIRNFHSDCGSEYINRKVAEMLEKLRIDQTKSRSRHCNDNALVESKNASTVRKYLGYAHIPAPMADLVSDFTRGVLTPYINYHCPCFFSYEEEDAKGKIRKKYRYEDMMTPYEKFRSLPQNESYLRPGLTLGQLDAIASAQSDNEAGLALQNARQKLFQTINKRSQRSAA